MARKRKGSLAGTAPDGSARRTAILYAEAVLSGDEIAGRLVKLACERFLYDLETADERGLWFDDEAADHNVTFFGWLRHTKGEWATRGEFISLEPWQVFNQANIFGWMRHNERGRKVRRFSKVYQQLARKNAKTTGAAGNALYATFFDGEEGAEGYFAATKKDQARYGWRFAQGMCRKSPELRKEIKIGAHNLHSNETDSRLEYVGADADTLDALGPTIAIVDEYHKHKTDEVREVLFTGMGAREQPLGWIITTAGASTATPCGEERAYATQVLEGFRGGFVDDSYFAYIAEPDEGDDWADESVWKKGNPNLGISVYVENLRDEFRRALKDPTKQHSFKRYRLNIWNETEECWIPVERLDRSLPEPPDLAGRPCFGGLDLAVKWDTNAFALVFPPDEYLYRDDAEAINAGVWSILCWCFRPGADLLEAEKRDRAPYRLWSEQGHLILTPGEIINYDRIRATIRAASESYSIQTIGFDNYNATQTAKQLEADGFRMVEVRQGPPTLSEPMKLFGSLVLSRRLAWLGNPIFRWQFSNTAKREDINENIAPDKRRSNSRIDLIAAACTALTEAVRYKPKPKSVYERRGIRTV